MSATAGSTSANLTTPSTAETLSMGPITIRILEDGSHTDNRIGCILLTIAPRTKGPAIHWHRMHDETFLVTKGKVEFTTDKTTIEAHPGSLVTVPPLAIHTFANPYDEEAEFFNTFTPAYYVDYLRMMVREAKKAQEKGEQLGQEKIAWVMAQFATFPVGAEGLGGEGQEEEQK